MTSGAKKVISRLRNFRTRSAAIAELVGVGEAAVDPLIQALKNSNEGIRYGVVRVLGKIKAQRACDALLEAAYEPALSRVVFDALKEITGENHGTDVRTWRAAIQGGVQDGDKTEVADVLIQQVVTDTEIDVSTTRSGWLLTVPLKGGRSQKVSVATSSSDSEGEQIIVIYTQCGPADPKRYEWALKQNLRMPYGAISIREIKDKPMFVMVDTQLARTAQADEIRKSVLELAKRADAIEKMLTGADNL